METKTGKIESIAVKKGDKNGKAWIRYTYTIDGFDYSTFDIGIGESFKVGDNVVMEGEQNGKYWNMKTMKYSTEAEKAQPKASNKEFQAHLSIEQVRTNALGFALQVTKNATTDAILLEVADGLVNWILTGTRKEVAK